MLTVNWNIFIEYNLHSLITRLVCWYYSELLSLIIIFNVKNKYILTESLKYTQLIQL